MKRNPVLQCFENFDSSTRKKFVFVGKDRRQIFRSRTASSFFFFDVMCWPDIGYWRGTNRTFVAKWSFYSNDMSNKQARFFWLALHSNSIGGIYFCTKFDPQSDANLKTALVLETDLSASSSVAAIQIWSGVNPILNWASKKKKQV